MDLRSRLLRDRRPNHDADRKREAEQLPALIAIDVASSGRPTVSLNIKALFPDIADVSRFSVEKELVKLGRGSFGHVFLVWEKDRTERFALKCFKTDVETKEGVSAAVEHELLMGLRIKNCKPTPKFLVMFQAAVNIDTQIAPNLARFGLLHEYCMYSVSSLDCRWWLIAFSDARESAKAPS